MQFLKKLQKVFKNKVSEKTMRKFIVSFSITMIACVLLVGGVYAAINRFVRPPEVEDTFMFVPPSTPAPTNTTNPEPTDSTGTSECKDSNCTDDDYDVLPPPEVTIALNRRNYFYTFMIFGVDEGNNVDAMMVAAFDTIAGTGYAINFPRDTQVVSAVQRNPGRNKIVSGYAFGIAGGRGHDIGVQRLKQEVLSVLGIQIIDFYIMVEYEIFEHIIDLLGGVEIYVWRDMIYEDPCQDLFVNLRYGVQTLTGEQALQFARFRYAGTVADREAGIRRAGITDYQRIENHQALINAVGSELLSPSTILRIPSLINLYHGHVKTNLSIGDMLWLGQQLLNVDGIESLSLYTLPTTGTSGHPTWYELPDIPAIVELVNRTINPFIQPITIDMIPLSHQR